MEDKLDKAMTHVWAVWNYIEAALLVAAGVMACVFRSNETLYSVFAYVIGAFVILDGILRFILIVNKVRKSQESAMLVSGFEVTIGIVVILMEVKQPAIFIDVIINFLSILLMAIGVFFLVYSIIVIAKKIVEQLFMPVMEIAFAAILIGVGVTMFVLYRVNDAEFKQVIMIILGSILILVAIAMAVVTTIGVHKRAKKRREQERQEVVRRNECYLRVLSNLKVAVSIGDILNLVETTVQLSVASSDVVTILNAHVAEHVLALQGGAPLVVPLYPVVPRSCVTLAYGLVDSLRGNEVAECCANGTALDILVEQGLITVEELQRSVVAALVTKEQTSIHVLREGLTDGADHLLGQRIVEVGAALNLDRLLLELVLIMTISIPDDASGHYALGQITDLALNRSTYHLAARGAALAVQDHSGVLELTCRFPCTVQR